MQVGQYNTVQAAVQGVASEGWAFYSGLGVSIAREIPFAFIQFPIYEALKRLTLEYADQQQISPSQGALCGSIAGSVAAAVTTPLDLLKTRQMIGHARQGVLSEIRLIVHTQYVSSQGMDDLPTWTHATHTPITRVRIVSSCRDFAEALARSFRVLCPESDGWLWVVTSSLVFMSSAVSVKRSRPPILLACLRFRLIQYEWQRPSTLSIDRSRRALHIR